MAKKLLLTKGMYADPLCSTFGLKYSQVRTKEVIRSGVWFNYDGVRLGRGDLSFSDLDRISKELKIGFSSESFIILSESKALWNLPNDLDATSPGRLFVMENADIFVDAIGIYLVKLKTNSFEPIKMVDPSFSVTYYNIERQRLYDEIGFDPAEPILEPSSRKAIKTSENYNGLPVYELDEQKYATGTLTHMQLVAEEIVDKEFYLQDFKSIPKEFWAVENNTKLAKMLEHLADEFYEISNVIVRRMFNDYEEVIDFIVTQDGLNKILAYLDGKIYSHEEVDGIPDKHFAFKID